MRKVVIIGAGHVGSHCGYTLAHSGITDEIVLVDVDKDKAYAQALDIADSVSFCERETVVRSGDYKDCEDAAIVVIAIGEARKPGQTRLDMLGRSVEMLKELLAQLSPYKISGIVVTITNPADIVADFVRKGLGLERNKVFGTGTLLDTARLIRTLSEESGVSRNSIQAFSFDEYNISKEKVLEATRQIGMTIIEGKKSTEFGIGRALTEMAACILRDEKKIMPASVLLQGEYGQYDVHCGVPCLIGKNGIEKIIELPLTEEEQEMLNRSCEIIKQHIETASQD